jgi:endo-1,4-beta-xylanase
MMLVRFRGSVGFRTAASAGVLATALTVLAAAPVTHAAPDDSRNPTHPTLRSLAAKAGLRIGTAVDMQVLQTDETYREKTATQFNSVTAENVMK